MEEVKGKKTKKTNTPHSKWVYVFIQTQTHLERTQSHLQRGKIDSVRTQGDQKAYYNWSLNVAELSHSHIYQNTDSAPTNMDVSSINLLFTGGECNTESCGDKSKCVARRWQRIAAETGSRDKAL